MRGTIYAHSLTSYLKYQKNRTNYNPHMMIYQCDTLEKINEMQKLIDKQKQVLEKKN